MPKEHKKDKWGLTPNEVGILLNISMVGITVKERVQVGYTDYQFYEATKSLKDKGWINCSAGCLYSIPKNKLKQFKEIKEHYHGW